MTSIIIGMQSIKTLKMSGKTSMRPLSRASAPVISEGSREESKSGSSSLSEANRSGSPSARRGTISPRFCTRTSATVERASASSLASPAPLRKLSQAAFAEFMEPSIVVEASLAVVPVIPSSPWITWIAWYTSFKLLMSYLTPLIFSASTRSRSISVFVPP